MANNTISLRSLLEKEKLNGINFLDWFRNLRIVLKQERKEYVIEEAVPNDPGPNAPRADKDKFKKHMDDMLDVGCLMLATMTPELQKQHEDMVAYEMIQNLKEIYEGQARQERYETSKARRPSRWAAVRAAESPSVQKRKRKGESGSPWRRPRCGRKASDRVPHTRTRKDTEETQRIMSSTQDWVKLRRNITTLRKGHSTDRRPFPCPT
ncbi:hypothetical protein GQ457_18G000150 [Hibiscus cannabinus]